MSRSPRPAPRSGTTATSSTPTGTAGGGSVSPGPAPTGGCPTTTSGAGRVRRPTAERRPRVLAPVEARGGAEGRAERLDEGARAAPAAGRGRLGDPGARREEGE